TASENPPARVELPMQVAPVGLRALVALVDVIIAASAAGLFSFIAMQFGALPADPRTLLAAEILVTVFFWFSYQLLYLTYAGATVGMALPRVMRCSLEEGRVSRFRRQAPALTLLLPAPSAGLGFPWPSSTRIRSAGTTASRGLSCDSRTEIFYKHPDRR